MMSILSKEKDFTCYYQSNHSKVETILLSALPKNTTSELAGPNPLNAERQAGKLYDDEANALTTRPRAGL